MSHELAEGALREAIDRLERAAPALRARAPSAIAEALAEAWGRLADPERSLGREARVRIPESSGLSLPGVAWALSQTLSGAGAPALREAVERMAPPRGSALAAGRLTVLVLAGNVFTACVQPLSLALLARAPVLVKASTKDDVLPRLFEAALAAVDPELAEALTVVSFPGGHPTLEATLLSRADVVSAYGGDRTIASLRARISASTSFVPHGHGLGVGWVPAETLRDAGAARAAAEAFALDVAAYDQRGCLSPHVVVVEGSGEGFAGLLADGLASQSVNMPRGALPTEVGAAQIQWRGVAEARGGLLEGDGWAVAYEGAAPLRVSPGWRNALVVDAADPAAFQARIAPLGAHLKCVGVAGDGASRRALADGLLPGLAPRVCAAGQMQAPALLDLADGRPPWEGLLRFRQVD